MHQHRKTPLWVSAVAIFVTIFAMLLFGGASYADEAQSAAQSTTAQSVGATTVAVTDEAQSSSSTAAVADAESSSDSSAATAAVDNNESTSSCTPQDISPGEVDTLLQTQDGSVEFTAYEAVQFSVSLTLFEGHCAGDSITISVPEELGTDTDFTPIPMTTPSGVTIGYATYSADHMVTIKLTSEVEVPGRKDFRASAWWRVHMSSTLTPGETRELRWNVDGVIRRQSIQVGTCDGCSQVGKAPSKWGSVDGGKQSITVVLPTAERNGQEFTVTDMLTSSGQQFNCDQLVAGRVGVYRSAGPWGQPMYDRFQDPTVVSCDSSKATLSVTLNTGEKARVELNVLVGLTDPGPWTDTVSVTSQDKSWEVSARIVRRESGGNAGFDTAPTPTPAPTPEPSPSPTPTPAPVPTPTPEPEPSTPPVPTPTPSPSATPAPSPSPTPSPSATPSASPTPSPSTTPEPTPSPSATPTPAPTPTSSTSPTPAPNPTPQHKKLAVTGVAGSATALAVALVALGGFLIWARRHQAARR